MDRNEIIIYLENLINLGTLRYNYESRIEVYDSELAEAKEKITRRSTAPCFDTSTIVTLIISVILLGVGLASFLYSITYSHGGHNPFLLFIYKFMLPLGCATAAVIIPLIFDAFSDFSFTISYMNDAKKHNKNAQRIEPQIQKEIAQLESQKNQTSHELGQINKLLAEAYSFNIIPMQFRTLPCIIYIYNYMTTSQQSLEDALLHSHMEEGIKQVSSRLNYIINQNMQSIRLLRENLETNTQISNRLNIANGNLNTLVTNVNYYYLHSRLL